MLQRILPVHEAQDGAYAQPYPTREPGTVSVRTHIKTAVIGLDNVVAYTCLPFMKEQGVLLSFMFHGIFLSTDELKPETVDPQQGITVEMLRELLLHFKRQSYTFVSPEDILSGLSADGKYVLITFDDGYHNNIRALPVLEELGVPAVFFVSTDHIKHGKAYWWDVVFRESKKRGRSEGEIRRAVAGYKRLRTREVERSLEMEFGRRALEPVGDLDRPFSPSELARFASHRLVFVGNHTRDHAILTNYSRSEVKEQIQGSQDDISAMTARVPSIIAYPNGNYSRDIIAIASQAGLRLGMTAEPGKNRLPIQSSTREAMSMKRFILWGNQAIDPQCRVFRSNLSLRHMVAGSRVRERSFSGEEPV